MSPLESTQSLRKPPGFVPEGLFLAVQQEYEKRCAILLNRPSLEEIKKIPQRAPANSIKRLLSWLWYEFDSNWICDFFVWKNILDIWWGFGWVAKNLYKSANEIIVVDPVFMEKDLPTLLQKNLQSQKVVQWLREQYLLKNPEKKHILNDISENTLVYHECSWWLEYSVQRFPNVIRNSSYWENLIWIQDNSQDVVFLNYVLSKDIVDSLKVIDEVKRVLKKDWIIIFSDYEDKKGIISYVSKIFIIKLNENDTNRIIFIGNKK